LLGCLQGIVREREGNTEEERVCVCERERGTQGRRDRETEARRGVEKL